MASRFPTSAPDHIPALDGVRGIAVLLVLIAHTRFPGTKDFLIQFGWAGVDLFFVLSGFLITRILLATRDSRGFFPNFYARRILRIWPLYYVVLASVFVLERSGVFHTYASGPAWICLFTFTQNIFIALFGWNAVPDWLEPAWSLGIEEQFYLLWPFLVRKLSLRSLKLFCLATILISPVLRGFSSYLFREPDAPMLLTFCHFDTLCFGILLAIFSVERKFDYGAKLLTWSVPAFVALVTVELSASQLLQNVARYSLLGVVCTGLVALCATPIGPGGVRRSASAIFTWAPLRYTGKISYALYLSHMAVFSIAASNSAQRFLRHFPGYDLQGWSQIAIDWASAFVVATLSWYFFESPILRLKRKFEDRPAERGAAAARG
ncbi:MAG: acyltransferase [Terriglobia bacterium]|nr:acyltransferase [Terriglobia bacterium]